MATSSSIHGVTDLWKQVLRLGWRLRVRHAHCCLLIPLRHPRREGETSFLGRGILLDILDLNILMLHLLFCGGDLS